MAEQPIVLTRALRRAVELRDLAVVAHPDDDVGVAKRPLAPGTVLIAGDASITVKQFVSPGHKFALRPLAKGRQIRRYGQIIGEATRAIEPGDHVHTHNLAAGELERDHAFCSGYEAAELVPEAPGTAATT